MENIEIKTNCKSKEDKKINLSRLLHDEIDNISMFLKNISNLTSFNEELSLFDTEKHLIASSLDKSTYQIDLTKDSTVKFNNDCYEIPNGLIFNLFFEKDLLGYIYFQNEKTEKEKILILFHLVKNLLDEIVRLKIEKKQLLNETLNSYREINLLYKFGGNISSQLDLNHVLKSVIIESKNIIKADTYAIYLVDLKDGSMQLKASFGNICNSTEPTHPDKVLAHLIVKTESSEIVNDIKQKQKMKHCSCNINSLMGIPLKIKDELFGVIIITSHSENQFHARDEKLVLSLATQAAIAIKNAYLEKTNWENKRQLALTKLINEEKEKAYKDLVGRSSHIININEKIPKDPIPYIINGEYGVGKNLLARKVHKESRRKDSPFITIDCAEFSSGAPPSRSIFSIKDIYDTKKSEKDFSYLELAQGGTLFLQNIDRLPKNLCEKLLEIISPKEESSELVQMENFDVRIVASSSTSLDKKVEKGEFDPKLYEIFNKYNITILPLRERKKDITILIEYFIKKFSVSLGKDIKGIDNKGYEKLLSYNYRIGNVKELKDVIERACILTESEIITSEYIFLDMPTYASKFSYNLLNIKPFYNLIKKGIFPRPLIIVSSIFVSLIFYFAFLSRTASGINLGTVLAWSVWWPLFTLSFFFVARLWCSICPINETGIKLRKIKFFNLKVPAFIQNNTHYFATSGFLMIIWAEEYFNMHLSGFRTGIILGIIVLLATITNILFPKNTWCRYICPLGYFAGTMSLTSILELRSNPDICANKCKTHDCFKGNDKIEGCPMLLHLQFIKSNLLCKLCMRCVRLCPNNSPQLNLRLPGWDISGNEHLGQNISLLVICLLSAPFAIIIYNSKSLLSNHLSFNQIYWISPFIIGLVIWMVNYIFYWKDKENNWEHFVDVLNFYIPLALAVNMALQLKFIPVFSKINISGTILKKAIQSNLFSLSLISLSQVALLIGGLIFSVFLMTVHFYTIKHKNKLFSFYYYFSHQIVMFIYCLLLSKSLIS
ncbi:MAG: sigma 54-interacting transcriptional regulator [Candidatus Firestonebacteria bacterium]|nr:sigma 54-interacting transcriptional regulator [Candidatus Firestonebacteria bacterium]